jgi:hypothetical protein
MNQGCPMADGETRMQATSNQAGRALLAGLIVVALALLGGKVGLASPWFAVLAAFCVLGLIDLGMPSMPLRVPPALREIRSWERRGHMYRKIGVLAFGGLLRRSPLRLLNRRVYLQSGGRDLVAVRAQVKSAECAHFWGGLVTVPYLALGCLQGWWSAVVWLLVFDLTGNVYPIFHLRFVRARLDRALCATEASAPPGGPVRALGMARRTGPRCQ